MRNRITREYWRWQELGLRGMSSQGKNEGVTILLPEDSSQQPVMCWFGLKVLNAAISSLQDCKRWQNVHETVARARSISPKKNIAKNGHAWSSADKILVDLVRLSCYAGLQPVVTTGCDKRIGSCAPESIGDAATLLLCGIAAGGF